MTVLENGAIASGQDDEHAILGLLSGTVNLKSRQMTINKLAFTCVVASFK